MYIRCELVVERTDLTRARVHVDSRKELTPVHQDQNNGMNTRPL
jgi:hypothetical protein